MQLQTFAPLLAALWSPTCQEAGPVSAPTRNVSWGVCCSDCCFIDGACRLANAAHPLNPCLECNIHGTGGVFAWSALEGQPCAPEHGCLVDGSCDASGQCTGTPVQEGEPCNPEDKCLTDGTCQAGTCIGVPVNCSSFNSACGVGVCEASTGECTVNPLPTETACEQHGEQCDGFVCDGTGRCVHPEAWGCAVEGACVAHGTPHPELPCWLCDAERTSWGWSPQPPGTLCGEPASCLQNEDGAVLMEDVCDHAGLCQEGSLTSCSPYASCSNPETCATSCSTNADCAAGAYCDDFQCRGMLAVGSPCSAAELCSSGFCVDGLCCESACDAPCLACAAGLTGQEDGACAAVHAGTDPHHDCPATDEETCGTSGVCAADGTCALWPHGAPCDLPVCNAFNGLITHACDGLGTCVTQAAVSCSPGVCRDGACDEGCLHDADCAPNSYCGANNRCSNANRPPVAVFTGPSRWLSNVEVVLSGADSHDPDGDALTYHFIQLLGPQAELTSDGAALRAIFPPVKTNQLATLELIVNDGEFASEPAIHVITVQPPPEVKVLGCSCSNSEQSPWWYGLVVALGLVAKIRQRHRRHETAL